MKNKDLKTVAEYMKKLDFCMMTTRNGNGTESSRPMSNNRNVDYDGDSYFFTYLDTQKVRDIETDKKVSLTYQTDDMIFIHVYGTADILTSKNSMKEYWNESLNMWFPEGLDTKGIAMIRINAKKIMLWHKEKEISITI